MKTLQQLQIKNASNAIVEKQTDRLVTVMTDMIMEYKSLQVCSCQLLF